MARERSYRIDVDGLKYRELYGVVKFAADDNHWSMPQTLAWMAENSCMFQRAKRHMKHSKRRAKR